MAVIEIFKGDLLLGNGEKLSVELELSPEVLRIVTGGGSVGAWPVRYCRASPKGNGVFDLSIDGEPATFTPVDPVAFAATAAEWLVSSSLADRISTIKTLPIAETELPSPPAGRSGEPVRLESRKMVAGAAVAAALVVGAYMVFVVSPGRPSEPGAVAPAHPVATVAPPVDWSDLTPPDFAARWNATAIDLGVGLTIPAVGDDGFKVVASDWISLDGTVDETGTMNSVVVSVNPEGPPESDQTALAVWGVVVATVDPGSTPAERRAIFSALGVDPDDPRLDTTQQSTDWDGNRYTIQYIELASLVLFQVRPL